MRADVNWTNLSRRQIAEALTIWGFHLAKMFVSRLPWNAGYRCRKPQNQYDRYRSVASRREARETKVIVMRLFCLILVVFSINIPGVSGQSPEPQWWKGNMHTHSLWSDGDDFPEMIADWYRQHGYHFLALSDHNTLSEGLRWMPITTVVQRGDENTMTKYRKRFGDAWVETEGAPDSDAFSVRLKPLDEFRSLLERAGEFIMIPAEELSDKSEGKPVHMGAINISEAIPPSGGKTVREAMQNNLRAILEHGKSHGREVLPHLNHPNFQYAITAEDLAAVFNEQFFEVYNGHHQVNHLGDKDHPSVERIWDVINAIRVGEVNVPPIFGLGCDDSHEYHGKPGARPGRGWVMVRSRYLTPEHLIRAMKQGDFYASSGVSLDDVGFDEQSRTLTLAIQSQSDTTYRTEFIATIKLDEQEREHQQDTPDRIGRVVATAEGIHPSYKLQGNELYVRAVVTSSKVAQDPSFENQMQQAWTQPVGWKLQR